jgi:hypothetical protein
MPLELAVRGVMGNWSYLGADLLADRFYLRGLGLDEPVANGLLALRMFLYLVAVGVLVLGADRFLPVFLQRPRWSGILAGVTFVVIVTNLDLIPWFRLARALPFTSLVACTVLAAICLSRRRDRKELARWFGVTLWAIYALALLGKMILNARLAQYGFVLAMPAALLVVAGVVAAVPSLAGARGQAGNIARGIGAAAVAGGLVFFLTHSQAIYARKDVVIGEGADAIRVDGERGRPISAALRKLDAIMSPHATLLVLPEGIGLNYWLRRKNPARYFLFIPAEFAAVGGERVILDEVREHPPDFVLLVDRPHAEFGVGPFGVDPRNGRRLVAWVTQHYERVRKIGREPFRDRGFGVVILRRRDR